MNEPSERLERLRFARRVVIQQAQAAVAQLDGWIAAEERREAERRRGDDRRPPAPEWLVQVGPNGTDLVTVHTGDCWAKGRRHRPLTRAEALDALTRHQVPPCDACRPDSALGILE
ncbi:DUF6233 domain-containing protein [Streptomyces sp. NPDC094468]|uniref:DUF6233 domain-containing protein n=1 Tax=Streptomyces sp. NPDC094468 TaxID=3366066 RepID=UPI003829D5D7